ncbi:MAG: PP2C family protein-serine/threonine phosphatase [Planctomycetota bacterium]|jgi:sigma-B regulation protein RsbU (phosphoserine phosphatase)
MKKFFFSGKKKEQAKRKTPPTDIGGDSTVYLTGDERVDSAKIKTLLDTMIELISSMDPDRLLQSILDRSIGLVNAERGILFLKDTQGAPAIKFARDASGNDLKGKIQYSTGVVNKVMTTGEPVLLKVGATEVADLSQSVVDLKLRAVMCVTLSVKKRILGVIYVDSRATSRDFRTSDLKFFDALANAMAITLENARLVAEYVETERLKESLEIARGIQQGLLPNDPEDLEGFDIAGALQPEEMTAGDYFDFISIPDDQLGLVVGDVTGHGIGPAILMSSVRAMLRGLTQIDFRLDTTLEYLNEQLDRDTDADIFMSLFLGALDLKNRTLKYGSAGHIPQYLYRAGQGEFIELKRTGMALGVECGLPFRASEEIPLEPGDVLALFTDGIIEARSGQEMFGTDRLKQLIEEFKDRPAARIVSEIISNVKNFSGRESEGDDLTLVVVKILES